MVQEDFDAEKTWSYRRDTHRSLALMILIASVRSRSPDSRRHQDFRTRGRKCKVVREFANGAQYPQTSDHPPAWWWQPAFEVVAQQEEMPPLCSIRLELTYAAALLC